jgi:hypothetical protein
MIPTVGHPGKPNEPPGYSQCPTSVILKAGLGTPQGELGNAQKAARVLPKSSLAVTL